MSAASRPVSTGKTRTCPHCKATILESLSICPGCMHHLRFDSEAAKRQVAAAPALRVEGIIRHPPLEQPLEYFVIIAIRNDRGEEVTRQVVNVGALQAAEKRTFTLSVEVLPPQAPVAAKSTGSTGTFKSPVPQPAAAVRPGAAPVASSSSSSATSASTASPASDSTAGSALAHGSASNTPNTPPAPQPGVTNPAHVGDQAVPANRASQAMPANPGQAAAATLANPGSKAGPGTQVNPGTQTSPANPGSHVNPGSQAGPGTQVNPGTQANPGSPANPAKPPTGYVLKPPSPGGPKRY